MDNAVVSHRLKNPINRKVGTDAARGKCKEYSSAMHPRSVETFAPVTVGQRHAKTPLLAYGAGKLKRNGSCPYRDEYSPRYFKAFRLSVALLAQIL